MTKTTKADIKKLAAMLKKARNKYDNELLNIERVWANLKPKEYGHRESLVRVASEMIEIDKNLKMWESKLKQSS